MMGRVESGNLVPVAELDEFYRALGEAPGNEPRAGGPPEAMGLVSVREVPVPSFARIFCLGANYMEHGRESHGRDFEPSDVPTIFGRWRSSLSPHGGAVPMPPGDERFDWEGELACVIGDVVPRAASTEQCEAAIWAYTCFNDLSARVYQKATSQWTLGKNADASGPIGPELVTKDEIGDPYSLRLLTRVNGVEMQDVVTGEMIFRFPEVIRYISGCITLRPGDVIASGTPKGVGNRMVPQTFLRAGDSVEVEIAPIGILRCSIASARQGDKGLASVVGAG